MITHDALDTFSKRVIDILSLVLINELGQYDVGGVTVPAIWSAPPDLPQSYKIVIGSGVECIFSREPTMAASNLMGRFGQVLKFNLLLRQWNINKSIVPAVQAVMASKYFTIHDAPVIRQYAEINGEIFYSQARILITATDFIPYT